MKGKASPVFSTEIVREILRRTNTKTLIQLLPWARSYRYALTENTVFIYSMARTKKREALFKWIGPLAIKRAILMGKAGGNLKIDSLDDAKKSGRIVTLRKDAKEQYLSEKGFGNLHLVNNWSTAVKMLAMDRVQLWTTTDLDAPVIAKHAGVSMTNLETAFVLFQATLYIGASKDTPDTIIDQWQAALDDMKSDGTFERYVLKWAKHYKTSKWFFEDGVLQTLN